MLGRRISADESIITNEKDVFTNFVGKKRGAEN
jgi:hypothetical protein